MLIAFQSTAYVWNAAEASTCETTWPTLSPGPAGSERQYSCVGKRGDEEEWGCRQGIIGAVPSPAWALRRRLGLCDAAHALTGLAPTHRACPSAQPG